MNTIQVSSMNYEQKYKEALKVIESLYNVVRYQSSSDALSRTPYNNKPITDAQVITNELLNFLSNSNSYNPDAIIETDVWNEEDEFTEFEKEYKKLYTEGYDDGQAGSKPLSDKVLKECAKELLVLARKKPEKSIENGAIEFAKSYMEDVNPSFEKLQESEELWKWRMSCLRGINKAYTKGKQDALKDLPKWKKETEKKDLEKHIAILEGNKVLLSNYLEKGDYYIDLEDLKTLPKEE